MSVGTARDMLLSVQDAVVEFPVNSGVVRALDRVSLHVRPAETVAVVGESGCGKTTLARAVLGLQRLTGGSIELDGLRVSGVSARLAERVGMVWQDPYASLDPRWRVGRSIEEPFRIVGRKGDVGAVLKEVGLEPNMADRFPHQLSGGQRQRVAIGRAIALRPPLVILDEPTAALDLSIQAQVLNLLKDLQQSVGSAFLFISHDLMTVRFLADRVAVMYLGQIVEEGPTEEVFDHPRHHYTRLLMDSAPDISRPKHLPVGASGEIPDPTQRVSGCRFAGRCPSAQERCRQEEPVAKAEGPRNYRCWFPVNH